MNNPVVDTYNFNIKAAFFLDTGRNFLLAQDFCLSPKGFQSISSRYSTHSSDFFRFTKQTTKMKTEQTKISFASSHNIESEEEKKNDITYHHHSHTFLFLSFLFCT
jgi:hypothetical protein